MSRFVLLAALLLIVLAGCASPPEGRHLKVKGVTSPTIVPATSVSPDHRYGITVYDNRIPAPDEPEDASAGDANPGNDIVELKTGRVVGRIDGDQVMMHMNHGGYSPAQWSKDSRFFVWGVAAKWYPSDITLVKITDGKIEWQRDLLKKGQTAILTRTRHAAPVEYAAWRHDPGKISRSYYPDGFGVDVRTGSELPTLLDYRGELPESTFDQYLTFPLPMHVELAGDLKEDFDWNLESKLEGTIDAEGRLTVAAFHLVKKGVPPKGFFDPLPGTKR